MTVAEGSPPLARGTAAATWAARITIRITPACAGNSMAVATHRGRGRGSPPLARGTATSDGNVFIDCGITPACAGNRTAPQRLCARRWDHPRLRGEQWFRMYPHGHHQGSPPLARGTAAKTFILQHSFRITPACAGNRSSTGVSHPVVRDHPRLRGEQYTALPPATRILGSPPLARGTGRP